MAMSAVCMFAIRLYSLNYSQPDEGEFVVIRPFLQGSHFIW